MAACGLCRVRPVCLMMLPGGGAGPLKWNTSCPGAAGSCGSKAAGGYRVHRSAAGVARVVRKGTCVNRSVLATAAMSPSAG